MKTSKFFFVGLLLIILVLISGCTLPQLSLLGKKSKAALQISADPKATVFLNEEHLGQTPYFKEDLKPGDYTLKLVPESTAGATLQNWQGVVKLSPGILTVVSRNLSQSEDLSSGYVLTLEPIAEKDKARLSVISIPDNVVVTLDDEPRGFSPLSLDNLSEGEHLLLVSQPGYKEEKIKAKLVKGYKLVISVQLAKMNEEKESPEATESAKNKPETSPNTASSAGKLQLPQKPYVKIKTTPTGWLNVRNQPGTSSPILVKIKPGETYKFIEANQGGWYKIEYEEKKQGWIARQYADLFQ